MRCRNCHTVMMETDAECPTCHASAARATAAPPGLSGKEPSGLLMMLPMFGGAVGGLLYAGLTTAADVPLPPYGGPPRESSPIKRVLGFVFLLGGGLLLLLAFVYFWDTRETAQREPTVLTRSIRHRLRRCAFLPRVPEVDEREQGQQPAPEQDAKAQHAFNGA